MGTWIQFYSFHHACCISTPRDMIDYFKKLLILRLRIPRTLIRLWSVPIFWGQGLGSIVDLAYAYVDEEIVEGMTEFHPLRPPTQLPQHLRSAKNQRIFTIIEAGFLNDLALHVAERYNPTTPPVSSHKLPSCSMHYWSTIGLEGTKSMEKRTILRKIASRRPARCRWW